MKTKKEPPIPNEYWDFNDIYKDEGVLHPNDDALHYIVECAEKAGIPRDKWYLIDRKLDYSGCYYESDTPSSKWVFPISVFD